MTDFSKKAQIQKTPQPTPGKMTKSDRKAYCDFIFDLSNGMCQCGCGKAIDTYHHSQRGANKRDDSLTGINHVCHTILHFSTDTNEREALTILFKSIGISNWKGYTQDMV